MRSFGIGCFHFGIKSERRSSFSTSEYVHEIERALGVIPSIGEIAVDYDPHFDEEFRVSEELTSLVAGEVFPWVEFLRVEFSLYIPARLQASLLNEEWAPISTGTEKFKVYIVSTFHGPVTLVESVDASEGSGPSYSVRVVREFLAVEFKKVTSWVTFEFMGPSPFHANVFLKDDADQKIQGDLECIDREQRGYDEMIFTYSRERFPEERTAFEFLVSEIENELGLYYEIVREKDKQARSWAAIEERMNWIRESTKGEEMFNIRTKHAIHQSRRILIDSLYEFKATHEVSRSGVQELAESTYVKKTPSYFRKFVENRVSRFPTYPVDALCAWLTHTESRTLKHLEISALFISAVLGGIVGALITALS